MYYMVPHIRYTHAIDSVIMTSIKKVSFFWRLVHTCSLTKSLSFSINQENMGTKLASSSTYHKFKTRHRLPDPKTSALLVIDMQNYFATMAQPILPTITTTIHLCRSAGIPIIFTRHRHKPGDDGGVLGEWWGGDLILDGTSESQLIPEVIAAAAAAASLSGKVINEVEVEVVEKDTYSAFRNTQLEERLGELGVKEVIITGVMTNLCCETTAREAFIRGFRVFFSTDATATSSPELHDATLVNMAYGFAYLVDSPSLNLAF